MTPRKTLAGVIGTIAAATLIVFTGNFEGKSNTPYRDSGGVWTVCKGQTRVPMRYYTDAECDAMLAGTLADVATHIEAVTPGFETLPDGAKTAAIDFAYNVGIANYQNSTFRKMLATKQLPAACDQILRWRYVGDHDCSVPGNKVCAGVWTRRQAERKMCRGEQ